jgi:Acetoacetate decarboxylase (ADC)
MISGTADPAALAAGAPLVASLAREPLACHECEVLQVVYEVRGDARQAMLPPALHPVNPPAITLTVLKVGASEVGPFTVAETRIVCRSGVRSRGFHVSCFVQGTKAGQVLADCWGYRVREAEVELSRRYHGTSAVVRRDGAELLDVRMRAPQALSAADVQFTDTMHLTRTPTGCRLVQVERAYDVTEAQRGEPSVVAFDGAAWGEPRLCPSHPVSAVSLAAEVTIRPIRYVCRPDVNALEGTERVG